jgi:hypothetical protein
MAAVPGVEEGEDVGGNFRYYTGAGRVIVELKWWLEE